MRARIFRFVLNNAKTLISSALLKADLNIYEPNQKCSQIRRLELIFIKIKKWTFIQQSELQPHVIMKAISKNSLLLE